MKKSYYTDSGNYTAPPKYVLRADPTRDVVEIHFVESGGNSIVISNAMIEGAIGPYVKVPLYGRRGISELDIPIAELKAAMASGINASVPEVKPKPPKKLLPAEEAQRLWDQL